MEESLGDCMGRYIDADLLLQRLTGVNSSVEQGVKYFNSVYNIIKEQPTADVVEVKNGRWISNEFGRVYICSECGRKETTNTEPYCHCGAKMDGTPKERGGEK